MPAILLHFAPVKSAELLVHAIQQISSARSLQEVIDVVKHVARTGTEADGASFVLRDGDRCHYVDEEAIGPLWKGRRFPMTACISGWAMHHRQAAIIPDIALDPRIPYEAYRVTFVRSLVMVPIRSAAPLGAIGIYWARNFEAAPETVHWLQALADATSAALEAVRANDEAARLRARSPRPDVNGDGEFVRMCAWTRRLHHDGEWLSLEAFLRARFGLETTHTISDPAVADLNDELGGEPPKA